MKRTFLCVLLTALLSFGCAYGDGITVTTDAPQQAVDELSVTWTQSAVGVNGTAAFELNGAHYVLILNGLPEQLDDTAIGSIIAGWAAGKTVTLSGDGLTDAEKFSNRIAGDMDDWLVKDNNGRSDGMWGDKSMCWAASASNMLWLTGRAQNAGFESVDAVFTWFLQHFDNNGGYSEDGVLYFCTGSCSEETLPKVPVQGLLPDFSVRSLAVQPMCPDDQDDDVLPQATALIEQLRNGGVLGISVELDSYSAPLKSDSSQDAYLSADGTWKVTSFVPCEATDQSLVYAADGSLVIVHEQNGIWQDAAGNTYADMAVFSASCTEADGTVYRAEDTPDGISYPLERPVDASEVDMDALYTPNAVGNGAHALTVTGCLRKPMPLRLRLRSVHFV